ncbi:PHP domain-containing protein [Gaiella sp.]|uniref:PHP domain-containing protein n=1 Tax=Gaiella sp. TaxID=2663207 RepID=UPI003262D623
MALRICLVTPFSWSLPHDVNEHVAGVAAALRRRGHAVTVVAPSSRTADLLEGRRALQRGTIGELVAIGAALPTSLTERVALPMGLRANLATALALGSFDVVHGFEPGVSSLSSAALLEAHSATAATFFSTERIAVPPRKNKRAQLLARVDVLLGTSEEAITNASDRFPGDYERVSIGVDSAVFSPSPKRKVIVVELAPGQSAVAKAMLRLLPTLAGWELVLARTAPLTRRPAIPAKLHDRARVRSLVKPDVRRTTLAEAAIFVPAPGGSARLLLEARSSACAIAEPAGLAEQPELASAAVARLAEDEGLRATEAAKGREQAMLADYANLAGHLESVYSKAAARRRPPAPGPAVEGDLLGDRDWITVDLHMHTSWSHDCSIEPQALVDHAESEGLGAIAVTDHNVFGGALEVVERARKRTLIVIPGEEVKTDKEGEIIGLFLREEIPRGMTFAETIAAIREQDGIVYIPHPFDRMHAIPSAATLQRHIADIDVLEVYNARLLFEAYNDEALRFQRKYGLLAGAGSDAHVLQGVGTGAVRMRSFNGPEEFLLSLRSAEVLRRPKSLAYLQSLKWAAQVKEKISATE